MNEVLTYEALKADRDALAVENAALKASRETLAKNALETCNDVFSAGFRNASLQLGLMESTGNRDLYPNPIKALVDEAIRELTTPATDAALAAIEARGVEKFAEATIAIGEQEKEESIIYAGKQAMLFAKQLREGK